MPLKKDANSPITAENKTDRAFKKVTQSIYLRRDHPAGETLCFTLQIVKWVLTPTQPKRHFGARFYKKTVDHHTDRIAFYQMNFGFSQLADDLLRLFRKFHMFNNLKFGGNHERF